MVKRILAYLRRVLAGRAISRSIDRNTEAADELDALLREVLRR